MSDPVDLARYRAELDGKLDRLEALKQGDGGGTLDGMSNERLAKLEGVVEGLRHVQAITLSLVALVVALVLAFGTYTLNRIGSLEANVNELPGKLSNSLNQVNQTLLQAVTASKQTPPQVILLPAPAAAVPQAPAK